MDSVSPESGIHFVSAPPVSSLIESAKPQPHATTVFGNLAARMLLVFAGTLLALVFALKVTGSADRSVFLWPVTGMALALSLPFWSAGKSRTQLELSAAAGSLIGGLLVGLPLLLGAAIAALTWVDLIVAGAILCPAVREFNDLKERANIVRFLLAAIGAPLFTGILGAVPVSLFLKTPLFATAVTSAFATSLGISVVLPAMLFLMKGKYVDLRQLRPQLKHLIVSVGLFLVIAVATFYQNRGPFLFIIFPPMIVMLLVLGLEGAVFASLVLSVVGFFATSHGHGPILLMTHASPATHLLVLQVFIWISLATALPVGALLDERKRAERKMLEAQSIYQILLQNTGDAIVLSSMDGSKRYASPGILKMTGWTPEEYLETDRRDTVHPEDRDMVQMLLASMAQGKRDHTLRYRIMKKGGGWKWVEAAIQVYGANQAAGYVGTIRDISMQKETEEAWQQERREFREDQRRMATLAETDPLTGLLNRRGLEARMAWNRRSGYARACVLMIDVDFFKRFNDTYGHQAGDACLIDLAKVLRSSASRATDVVARIGGEEFVVVIQASEADEALNMAATVCVGIRAAAIAHTASPFGQVTLSMGVAVPTSDAQDLNLLLTHADRALYLSKNGGRNRVSIYEGPITKEAS